MINLVCEEMASAMNVTAIEFDAKVCELSEAGLETRPSLHIKPPRIAGSPVAMECELMQIVDLGPSTGLVLGRVLALHVREDVILDADRHYVDTPKMRLIGRMHSGWYTRASNLFRLERISRAEWKADNDGTTESAQVDLRG